MRCSYSGQILSAKPIDILQPSVVKCRVGTGVLLVGVLILGVRKKLLGRIGEFGVSILGNRQ